MGSGRRGRPGDQSRLANGSVARALRDLQANQGARRPRYNVTLVELDELQAIKKLAYDTFGATGVVEFDQLDPFSNRPISGGMMWLGYFLDPPGPKGMPPDPRRKRLLLFNGCSHRELVDQVRLWRARGGEA